MMIPRAVGFCLLFSPSLVVITRAATQFDVPADQAIVCADSLDSVCQAPTSCNANCQAEIDSRDSFNLGGFSQQNGMWIIRGGYTIAFPASCEVTCQGDCVCEGCASVEVADFDTSTMTTGEEEADDESTVEGIDFPGCYSDLNRADRNGDGWVKRNEYLNFIQEYGKRICFSTDQLTLQQSATFNTLACICRTQEGSAEDCCLGDNAQIPTAGSLLPESQQTPSQRNYLTSVCKLTDATICGQCPPSQRVRGIPPPALEGSPFQRAGARSLYSHTVVMTLVLLTLSFVMLFIQ